MVAAIEQKIEGKYLEESQKKAILEPGKNYKLTSSQINIAQVYAFISYGLGYNECPLIPYYYWNRKKFDENKFWADNLNLLENYDFSNDSFYKNLSIQLNNNFRNMISDSSYLNIAK
jgi:hypothetical protein